MIKVKSSNLMIFCVKDQYMFIHDVLGLIIEEKMQKCSRRIPSGVFYQNEGHTVNVYNELYESSESITVMFTR